MTRDLGFSGRVGVVLGGFGLGAVMFGLFLIRFCELKLEPDVLFTMAPDGLISIVLLS